MDQKRIRSLIQNCLNDLNISELTLYFEEDSVLRIEVVSNDFIGIRLLRRIDLISKKLLQISMNELVNYQLIYNPLTLNEKYKGILETNTTDPDNGEFGNGYAARMN